MNRCSTYLLILFTLVQLFFILNCFCSDFFSSIIGVTSEVIQEFIKGETYTLEYIVSATNAPKRHIQSVFALRPQESVIGLTVQTKQVRSPV